MCQKKYFKEHWVDSGPQQIECIRMNDIPEGLPQILYLNEKYDISYQ